MVKALQKQLSESKALFSVQSRINFKSKPNFESGMFLIRKLIPEFNCNLSKLK